MTDVVDGNAAAETDTAAPVKKTRAKRAERARKKPLPVSDADFDAMIDTVTSMVYDVPGSQAKHRVRAVVRALVQATSMSRADIVRAFLDHRTKMMAHKPTPN